MSVPRIHWDDLPQAVRSVVQEYAGPVLKAETASGGANSGIAATLHTSTQKIFIKGIPNDHRKVCTQRREMEINPYILPVAPRVLWQVETDGWNVLGFEHVDGRHADFSPGSPDLPKIADLVRRLGRIPCPNLPLQSVKQRWVDYADESALEFLTGDALLHTDFAPHNVLVNGRAYLIDWAWPTRGPAWFDVAVLLVRLVDAAHTPAEAAAWAQQFPAWQHASDEAIDAFAVANRRMWQEIAQADSLPWKNRLAAAARKWSEYRLS
ncbi:aminoglycoside phosphotransferase [Candidatus Protofrankia californiensis]|uniref:Aminoglycoside phosphotransferase n=1 Tax=Candidatus Protofrankia californiensis TaxID=1839754 RepID=A0A1C3P4A3_9ACTN|nr:aminoglycoside phosphotransferase [Candidatus Protofrankia californiensis]